MALGCVFTYALLAPITSQAGIALAIVGGVEMFRPNDSGSRPFVLGTVIPGGVITITGSIIGLTGNIIPGLVLAVLAEDGTASQEEIEMMLMAKYPNINDREAVLALAQIIKAKADLATLNAQGLKSVNLSEDEVKSILNSTELSQEEIQRLVKDLK